MKTAMDLVAIAKTKVDEISIEMACSALQEAGLVIDVREPEEYNAGHIEGAVNIPRGLLEFKLSADPALENRSLNVVIYCKTSGRAALSACAMQEMGYLHVQSIAGGYDAWRAAGKSVIEPSLPKFD